MTEAEAMAAEVDTDGEVDLEEKSYPRDIGVLPGYINAAFLSPTLPIVVLH